MIFHLLGGGGGGGESSNIWKFPYVWFFFESFPKSCFLKTSIALNGSYLHDTVTNFLKASIKFLSDLSFETKEY